MPRCSWGTCNSDSRYPERCVGIKFIPFVKAPKSKPWNREKCLRWIKACGRPHVQLNIYKLNKNHHICSKHFVDGEPTSQNPDPVPTEPQPSCQSATKRKLPKKRGDPATPAPKMRKTEAAKVLLSLQHASTTAQASQQHTLDVSNELMTYGPLPMNSSSNQQKDSQHASTTVQASQQHTLDVLNELVTNQQDSQVCDKNDVEQSTSLLQSVDRVNHQQFFQRMP